MLLSPLEQFVIIILFSLFDSFLIFLLPILVYVYISLDINLKTNIYINQLNNNIGSFIIYIFSSISNIVKTAGSSLSYFYLFIFIIVLSYISLSNLLGLLPWGFTLTSHLIIAFFLALSGFGWLNLVFILRFPTNFVSLFLPGGTPFAIVFIIIPIEILSYVSRVLSLSIRLFANMMSGHTLLHILAGFVFSAISINWLFLVPLSIINLILFVEVGVALLQVYVFITLLNLYVNDTKSPTAH